MTRRPGDPSRCDDCGLWLFDAVTAIEHYQTFGRHDSQCARRRRRGEAPPR